MSQVTWEVEQPPPTLAERILLLQVRQHDAFWAGRLDEVRQLTDEQIATIAKHAGIETAA